LLASRARWTGIDKRVVGSREKVVAIPSSNTIPGGGARADVYRLRVSGFNMGDLKG
jgi:hypothetical protein